MQNATSCTQRNSLSTVNVDVDSMDPTFARSLPFKPHDQTSNQLLVNEQMSIPENKELFLNAVKEYKDQGWEAVLDRIVGGSISPAAAMN